MIYILAWILVGASLAPAHRRAYQASRRLFVALVTAEVVAIAMIVVARFDQAMWSSLAQEDGVVEWATVLAFAMAAGWLLVIVRRASPSWWFQGACVLLAAFCIVVAGEEISWGQRLFAFKPPDVFLERNFQQELNLHNVLMDEGGVGFEIPPKYLVIAIALGFAVALPLLVRRRPFKVLAPLAPPWALLPLALGVVAAEIDYPVDLTGEGAELVAGLLFLASAIAATSATPRATAAWMIAPVVSGALLSVVFTRVLFASDEAGVRVATAELAILKDDIVSGMTPRVSRRSFHKRVYTSSRDGYLQLSGKAYLEGRGTPAEQSAQSRHDRRGYFLDPWNNPYWVQYDHRRRIGTIYSFGPNRKRDLTIADKSADIGDDVVVRFAPGDRGITSVPDDAEAREDESN